MSASDVRTEASVTVELLTVGWCTAPRAALMPVAPQGDTRRWRDWVMTARCPALVLLVRHPAHGVVLVDTGYAPRFAEATQRWPERAYALTTPVTLPGEQQLLSQLAARGVAPSEVRHVLLTHLHADHVAGVRDFPTATLHATRAAVDDVAAYSSAFWSRLRATRRATLPRLLPDDFASRVRCIDDRACDASETPEMFAPLIGSVRGEAAPRRAYDLFGDGSMLAIDVPGHAPGMVGFAFPTLARPLLLVADAVWSVRLLEPGMRAGIAERRVAADVTIAAESIQRLQAFVAQQSARADRYTIVSSHDEESIRAYRDGAASSQASI